MGLNSIYESVRSQLLHRENKPSLEEAIAVIRQAESRIRVTPESQVQNSAALLTKKPETQAAPAGSWTMRPPTPNSATSSEGEDSRDALFCSYCKKRRHTKENCWKLAWKNQKAGKKAYASTSQTQNPGVAVVSPELKKCRRSLALLQSSSEVTLLPMNGLPILGQ